MDPDQPNPGDPGFVVPPPEDTVPDDPREMEEIPEDRRDVPEGGV